MGRLFFDAALVRVTSYLRDMHPGGMDIFAPVFVCGANIGWVTMSLSETSWYCNIEGENVNTNFSPVSFVL
jgi:hypothetical protein